MLRTKDLRFKYPREAEMRFPDLSIDRGEAFLILGASGCGKTTLLNLLSALLKPSSGELIIDDKNLATMTSAQADNFRGKNIGLIYQKSFFIEALTVFDNLMISPFSSDEDHAIELAESLEIKDLLDKLPGQLSVGEQQRVSIARALLHNPKLILADEPTSALDDANCERVAAMLKKQARTHNATLIIVTHDGRLRKHIDQHILLERSSVFARS